jgi:ketosteroid isomerase-like protein
MSEQENIQLVQQCYDAFVHGDLDKLLSMMAQDIAWELPQVDGVPFTGKRRGRQAVAEFFGIMSALQEAREFRPMEFTAQEDRVVVTGHYEWAIKATQECLRSDFCHIFHIANGEVVKFTEFSDTHKAAVAYQLCFGATQSAPGATGDSATPGLR